MFGLAFTYERHRIRMRDANSAPPIINEMFTIRYLNLIVKEFLDVFKSGLKSTYDIQFLPLEPSFELTVVLVIVIYTPVHALGWLA
jgi:hypothetical protein